MSSSEKFPGVSGSPETVFLGVGTNVGDRMAMIELALARLGEILSDLRVSPVYETEPLHYRDQPSFLNACVGGICRLAPRALLAAAFEIERAAGRDRTREIPKGPRPLDLDLLLFGSRVIDEVDLQVPHPRLNERAFVLRPLLDLAPDVVHPATGERLSEAHERLPHQGIYLRYEHPYTPHHGGQS
ncbi:MAG: 2-amino-4-hydroxy-6-hydroxymethyldihydropteridine diphosphokinase [Spirochaetaceae bacterium]